MSDKDISWSNPKNIDLKKPYIYRIRVKTPNREYCYVGKGSKPSRMGAYESNVSRVLRGESKRPLFKKNGERQSEGNIKFRFVHLVLATAVQEGWLVEHYPIENCSKEEHLEREKYWRNEHRCNMNEGKSWFVEEFNMLSKELIQNDT